MSTPNDAEAQALEIKWLNEVYQPDAPQLTLRALVAGLIIGAVMCCANLYIVLKTGWSVGVPITAGIMAWAFFAFRRALPGGRKVTPLGTLENNAVGSVASAAGYMTGGGNMAALPALIMLTGQRPDSFVLIVWFACIAALGVFAAIPFKRQLINREQLIFPTGTATAETLRALHAEGETGRRQARWLGWAGLVGATITWFRDARVPWMSWNLPAAFAPPIPWRGRPLLDWTVGIEGSVLMLGAGGLMSWRTGWSLLIGSIFTFGFVVPELVDAGIVVGTFEFKTYAKWTVWMGAAVLVSSGLTSFALQWRSVVASFRSLSGLFGRRSADSADPLAAIEAPQSWFLTGFAVLGPPTVVLAWWAFDIPIWAGILALPLSVVMALIAARVTGETDVTPTKALGPVTQLTFAGLLPGQLVPNIMSANITGGAGLHAADLLTDLKSGYLLGARPRQQVVGQLFGVIIGAIAVVPLFNLLVPTADDLGGKEFPAPSAMVWKNVSAMLVKGLEALPESARWAALGGLLVGAVLALLEAKVPKHHKKWVPSASGLGIAMVLPAWNSIMMFLGAAFAEWLRRRNGVKEGDAFTTPVASGFVAGESLMGVLIKVLIARGVMHS